MSFQHIERSASVVTIRGESAFRRQLFIEENPGAVKFRVPRIFAERLSALE